MTRSSKKECEFDEDCTTWDSFAQRALCLWWANNPTGLSKTMLVLDFPKQITLGKWWQLWLSASLTCKVKSTESHDSVLQVYLLFPPSLRITSQLCHSQRKTILSAEKRGYIYAVVPATFFLIVSDLSKTEMEYVFLLLSTLTPSNTTFVSPKIPESGPSCSLRPSTGEHHLDCSHCIPITTSSDFSLLVTIQPSRILFLWTLNQDSVASNSKIVGDLGRYKGIVIAKSKCSLTIS